MTPSKSIVRVSPNSAWQLIRASLSDWPDESISLLTIQACRLFLDRWSRGTKMLGTRVKYEYSFSKPSAQALDYHVSQRSRS